MEKQDSQRIIITHLKKKGTIRPDNICEETDE